MLFSCLPAHATDAVRTAYPRGAVWAVPAESVTGPFDVERARPIADDDLYVGRLIRRRADGARVFLAFRHIDEDGAFIGGVTDPIPVGWDGDRLVLQQS